MSFEDKKTKYWMGKRLKDTHCSEECAKDSKCRTINYYIKYYNCSIEEAKEYSLEEYYKRGGYRLPSQLEYWINKGFTEDQAKNKVSESQAKNTLESFIERYGKDEGTSKYNNFCDTRSIKYSGEGNPRYGYIFSDEEKYQQSKVLTTDTAVSNIVNSINNNLRTNIIGYIEPKVWDILKDLNIEYKPQFAIKIPKDFNKINQSYLIFDLLLPEYNLIIEINEDFHNKTRDRDLKKLEIAEYLGYKTKEIWTKFDLKNQILQTIQEVQNNETT
jgi:hypothetical protein